MIIDRLMINIDNSSCHDIFVTLNNDFNELKKKK